MTAVDEETTLVVAAPGKASALPVGSRLAEFEITGLIGQGGFGAVYEARDHALERRVAIKEYLPASLSLREADGAVHPVSERERDTFELGMRSFINEARLLAQFDHPSLLKVYRFWQERGTAYMVMPLYRGPTLRQALAQAGGEGVREDWLLRIVDGLAQALAVMHRADCYHRDVAPDNILLLEESGAPVLLDFGAARRVIGNRQALTVILKPGYAPVEQYAEVPGMKQGAWTDVYALAAVMHVAVAGRPPPPSVGRLMADSYHPLAAQAELRQRFSTRLLGAIDAGLAVRPEARPQSMEALRELLGLQGAAGASPAAKGATTPAPGRRLGLALGVVAALAAAGGWLAVREHGAAPAPLAASSSAPGSTSPQPSGTASPPSAPPPRTAADSLASLAEGAAPGFVVTASPRQREVRVGKDKLGFELRSSNAGYVYVYLLSTNGELSMLFPNLLDRHNRVEAGQTLSLPRASWPMDAGGPPGTDRFAVLVSEHERDFTDSGMRGDGIFPQFPLPVLAALEAARGSGPPPLAGKPVCAPGVSCEDAHGVAMFEIDER